MLREIIIDAETTGLDPDDGHRLIELASVEVFDKTQIGANYHAYINPEMVMDHGVVEVHGISNDYLIDKPTFQQVADGFLGFVGNDRIIAHNAPFDIKFLDSETTKCGFPQFSAGRQIFDTLEALKQRYPNQRNNIDSLVERFEINFETSGALLDVWRFLEL